MRKLEKFYLESWIKDLQFIINGISVDNCYDYVVEFFSITSRLYDHLDEISELPLKGWKIWSFKSKDRKQAEAKRAFFIKEVEKAGRCPYGINRTKCREEVTKNNLYFGNIHGIWTGTVAKFEKLEDSSTQLVIRQ